MTAIEFAIVGLPFLMMLFGIIGIGLFFFTTFTMENAVEQAARVLRTGEAQTTNMTPAAFKTKVCDYVPGFVDCGAGMQVNVLSFADSSAITPGSLPSCLSGGALATGSTYSPGGPSSVVLVWVCYEWTLANKIPFLNLGNMGNGSRLIQATTVFRSEPY